MMQKVVVGVLVLTVLGALGIGIYDAMNNDTDPIAETVLGQNTPLTTNATAQDLLTTNTADVAAAPDAVSVSEAEPVGALVPAQQMTATPAAVVANDGTQPIQQQINEFKNTVGDPWNTVGTITTLETSGVSLMQADGSTIFVELGPSNFWNEQGVTLLVGDMIKVEGFYNGENYHAATVTTASGAQLMVRSAEGQPLWSGGANGGNGNGATANTEVQVAPEDWVTVEGTVELLNGSILSVRLTDGSLLDAQLGQVSFINSQNIAFVPSDAVRVLGLWQGTQFRAGEVTKLATGERLMLLDPNGRPLWGGPGRNGNSGNTTGNAANTTTTTAADGTASTTSAGQGQGGQGQGNQGKGNQGQGQGRNAQTIQIPAEQWESITGQIMLVEPLTLTLQLATGEQARVNLGELDFWTEQGIWFPLRDTLTVEGYWLNGEFEAGIITFASTNQQLTIRDTFGRLLWQAATSTQGQGNSGGNGGNNGNGNGYRGGRQ